MSAKHSNDCLHMLVFKFASSNHSATVISPAVGLNAHLNLYSFRF